MHTNVAIIASIKEMNSISVAKIGNMVVCNSFSITNTLIVNYKKKK